MEIWKREKKHAGGEDEEEGEEDDDLPNLPQEIMMEILSRLPAKSIGRFRCVSKLFLSILSHPRFLKTHLSHALNDLRHHRLILSSHNLYSVDYEFVDDDNSVDLIGVELNYPLKDEPSFFSQLMRGYVGGGDGEVMIRVVKENPLIQRNWVDIVGSCNGLVCISPYEGRIFVFNPTTGESKRVPEPPALAFTSEEDDYEAFGFGFDAFRDDYKVVRLVSCGGSTSAAVYSLRMDSWKCIGELPYDYDDNFYMSGVALNGAVHWVVSRRGDDDNDGDHQERVVVVFDLSSERFWDMPLPDETDFCSHRFRNFIVGVLDGCLCIVNSCHETHDEVWLMREYGVANSWTKLTLGLSYRYMKPLCSAKNGQVLLELNGDMILYNLENHTYRELEIHGVELTDAFEADTYVESLISPNLYYGNY